jgi:hypothetical protein
MVGGAWEMNEKLHPVVRAAVAIARLNRKAKAFGDSDSAIWVPIAEP